MSEPSIRERLVGCWRLVGFDVTAAEGGQTSRPLGDDPLGTILYTPDGYMSAQLARPGPYAADDQEPDAYYIAYSGPYDVDEQAGTVAHHLQVSVIPSWLGTTQLRQVQFREPAAPAPAHHDLHHPRPRRPLPRPVRAARPLPGRLRG